MDKPFPEARGEDSINKVSKLFDKNAYLSLLIMGTTTVTSSRYKIWRMNI